MVSCPIYDPVGTDRCGWCRQPPAEHPWRWCPSCRGDRSIPDVTDRRSHREHLPLWLWRHVPCGCRLEGDSEIPVRRGGVVTPDGVPVEDVELDAAGVG